MSYLAQPTSLTDYGVVQIGQHISVIDGVISLDQDLSPSADVTFNSLHAGGLFSSSLPVLTSITPTAGAGIALSSVVSGGPAASFTVTNTGVLSLTAGPGITVDHTTGNITISAVGADLIHVYGTTTNYTATAEDEYIGVNSTGNVTITLPAGIVGRVYTIKDEHGTGSGKIFIQPQTGEKIDGLNNYVISVSHASVTVVFRAGGWWIM